MRPFIIGTAGHIDHGKSALVQALTGIHPDRLPEEKRRGISIELGFAHGTLEDGVPAAFVDVPGHERFVRTMVAGAHGVDVLLFVVALDEGVMPQTREHADICRLLGVPRAVIALTKEDLAAQLDPEWPALVEEDIRALGEPLASAPLVRVSARTGAGLAELRRALTSAGRSLPSRPTDIPPHLPIDRAFSLKGHGTVVTGTLLAGKLAVGDEIDLVTPAPRQAGVRPLLRARTLHVHGEAVPNATAGQRVAMNVPGLDVTAIDRGAALAGAGAGVVRQGALLDVTLEAVPSAPPLRNRARLMLHLGTAQALATVDLLGLSTLDPGQAATAQLRLDRALPALRDQRFVLRGFRMLARGGQTVAGGRVLWIDRRRRRATDRPFVESLVSNPVPAILSDAGPRGVDQAALRLQLNGLPASAPWIRVDARLFAPETIDALAAQLLTLIRERGEIPREEARSVLGSGVRPEAFQAAVQRLPPEMVAGELLGPPVKRSHPLEASVEVLLDQSGLTPPTAAEMAVTLKVDKHAIGGALRSLAKAGRAVRLTDELFVQARAAAEFKRRVVEALRDRGSLTTLELKELSGASRKFAIPLCEWLDAEHVTLRVGDKRTLRRSGPA